jgi:hypothetical protein
MVSQEMLLQIDDYVAVGIEICPEPVTFKTPDMHQVVTIDSRSQSQQDHSTPLNSCDTSLTIKTEALRDHDQIDSSSIHLNDSEQYEIEELMSFQQSQPDETSSENWLCSHRLENLSSGIKTWSVRAYVTAISAITEFQRANDRGIGKFMRVQLRDTNAQLEVVVFAPYCDREPFTSLKLNNQYHFSDGEIKHSNPGMLKWPYEQLSRAQKGKFRQIKFDIQVNKNTSLCVYNKTNEIEKNYVCGEGTSCSISMLSGSTGGENSSSNNNSFSSSCSSSSTSLHPSAHTCATPVINQQEKSNVSVSISSRPSQARLRLSDFIQRPVKSLVTVLCVVCKMLPYDPTKDFVPSKSTKYLNQKDIAVRRVVIVDTSGVTVPVALWGDQAKFCTLKVGHCVLFKDVEVSNFNGISFSVLQRSGMMCFGSCDTVDNDVEASKAIQTKHSKASRIMECTQVDDAYFNELTKWWQSTGSFMYRN